jgi:multidrug efflux pump subunit AcrA (membrane-fusion protein)
MRPGQRVQAELLLAAVEDALVVPRQAVFEVEGESVVYRRRDGGYEAVPVTLGPSGPGRVVVESGLEEGDVIALADPAAPLPAADGGALLGGVPSPEASR